MSTIVKGARLATVHVGTAFEERSLDVLQRHLSMSLTRVGGKSDGGIDLQGWWWIPPPSSSRTKDSAATLPTGWPDDPCRRRLRILAQCKAEEKKLGPNYIRELEGVLHTDALHAAGQSSGSSPAIVHPPVVGLMISQSPFTKASLMRAMASPLPFMLLHLPPVEGSESAGDGITEIGGCVWNPALGSDNGLLKGQFELRWEMAKNSSLGRPGLWWHRRKLQSWVPDIDIDSEESNSDAG